MYHGTEAHTRDSWRIINLFYFMRQSWCVEYRFISFRWTLNTKTYALLKTKQISSQFYLKFSLVRIKLSLLQEKKYINFQGWVSFDSLVSNWKVNMEEEIMEHSCQRMITTLINISSLIIIKLSARCTRIVLLILHFAFY